MPSTLVLTICEYSFIGLSLLAIGVFRWSEGLWGNFILACNIIFAFMFMNTAGNFAVQKLGESLNGMASIPFIAWATLTWWLGFGVTLMILQKITKSLSSVNVKYPPLLETILNLCAMFMVWFLFILFFKLEYEFLYVASMELLGGGAAP